jgi:hypothetical protein
MLLANSQGIAPKSLQITGGRLFWTENGKPRSATLN